MSRSATISTGRSVATSACLPCGESQPKSAGPPTPTPHDPPGEASLALPAASRHRALLSPRVVVARRHLLPRHLAVEDVEPALDASVELGSCERHGSPRSRNAASPQDSTIADGVSGPRRRSPAAVHARVALDVSNGVMKVDAVNDKRSRRPPSRHPPWWLEPIVRSSLCGPFSQGGQQPVRAGSRHRGSRAKATSSFCHEGRTWMPRCLKKGGSLASSAPWRAPQPRPSRVRSGKLASSARSKVRTFVPSRSAAATNTAS